MSIVQDAVALPEFPAASVAVTLKVCEPASSGPTVFGLVHVVAVTPSTLHWKLAVFEAWKAKSNDAWFVNGAGCASNVTVGGVVSIVHEAVELPELPALSVAVTLNVCEP